MASIVLEDNQVILNAVIFSKILETEGVSEQLQVDSVVVVSGKIEKDDYRDGWQLVVDKVENIDAVKEKYARSFEISLNSQHLKSFEQLATVLKRNHGKCPVKLTYQMQQSTGFVLLNSEYSVCLDQQLIKTVNNLLGSNASRIHY
jgi:DNA polymerase-3 subunit alpha